MNLIFIGLSGSGKSTFGEYCAALTGKRFIDVDREIENEYGKISEIFSSGGESLFRAIEEKKLIDLAETKDGIIATGGGAVLNPNAMSALKSNGLCVYLKCGLPELEKRIAENSAGRPLFEGKDIAAALSEMYAARAELYERYADITINEDEVLLSRGLLSEPLAVQTGALYIELVRSLEKKVYAPESTHWKK